MVCGDPNLRNFYVFLDHNQDVYIYGENSCRLVRLLKKKRQAFQSKQTILQKVRANDPQIKELQIAIASIDAKIASIVKAMHTESQKFVSCFDVAILPRLNVNQMKKSLSISKGVKSDLGWIGHCKFHDSVKKHFSLIEKTFLEVSEARSTRDCSRCGRCSPPGKSSIFSCCNPTCRLVIARDVNSCLNIMQFALMRYLKLCAERRDFIERNGGI